MVVRQYQEELKYLEKISDVCWRIKKGFQPNMKVNILSFNKLHQVLKAFQTELYFCLQFL